MKPPPSLTLRVTSPHSFRSFKHWQALTQSRVTIPFLLVGQYHLPFFLDRVWLGCIWI